MALDLHQVSLLWPPGQAGSRASDGAMLPRLSVTASEELHLVLKQRSRAILPLLYVWLNCGARRGGGDAARVPLSLDSAFEELLVNLVEEIADMIRRVVQGIPESTVEYLGRFLIGISSKVALQRLPRSIPAAPSGPAVERLMRWGRIARERCFRSDRAERGGESEKARHDGGPCFWMAPPRGLEPPTHGLGNRRSIL